MSSKRRVYPGEIPSAGTGQPEPAAPVPLFQGGAQPQPQHPQQGAPFNPAQGSLQAPGYGAPVQQFQPYQPQQGQPQTFSPQPVPQQPQQAPQQFQPLQPRQPSPVSVPPPPPPQGAAYPPPPQGEGQPTDQHDHHKRRVYPVDEEGNCII